MKAHEPTPESRKHVMRMASFGIPQSDIAKVIGVADKTLRLHYREELDIAEAKANTMVAGALYKQALKGHVTAQIFWLKTRARWKDTAHLELTGPGGGAIQTITGDFDPKEAAEAYSATLKDQRK